MESKSSEKFDCITKDLDSDVLRTEREAPNSISFKGAYNKQLHYTVQLNDNNDILLVLNPKSSEVARFGLPTKIWRAYCTVCGENDKKSFFTNINSDSARII